jgi:hypothetical protein
MEFLPSPLRVTLNSGEQVMVYNSTLTGERILGFADPSYDSAKPKPLSIPLDTIALIEYDESSLKNDRPNWVVISLVGMAIVIWILLASTPWYD